MIPRLDADIFKAEVLEEIHNDIVAPFEEFEDAYEYFSSAEVQDTLINEYETDVLTAPVDDSIPEIPTVNPVSPAEPFLPPDIQARLKIFQEEYQLEDDELDMVVEMILAESRMMEVKDQKLIENNMHV